MRPPAPSAPAAASLIEGTNDSRGSPARGARAGGARLLLPAWGLTSLAVLLPLLSARLWPPPGRAFTGAFMFQDDHAVYLSFVEQASRGAWTFTNKFDLRPHEPFLVNLTWWLGGVIARVLRSSPIDGYLVLHLLAPGALILGAARVLSLGGLQGQRQGWAVTLFLTGGGLGWLGIWRHRPVPEALDLGTTLFPFMQLLLGPHSLVGTALLLLTLGGHLRWRLGRAGRAQWLLPACLLGVTRPFELGLFLLVAGVLAAREAARRGLWPALAGAAELLWLLPVLTYDFLVFRLHPSFSLFASEQNRLPAPTLAQLAWALGPVALLALLGRQRAAGLEAGETRATLQLAAVATAAAILSPVLFGLQFVSSLGAVLLLVAALRCPPRHLALATLLLAPSAVVALWRDCNPPPQRFPPAAYVQIAAVLRAHAQKDDVVLATPDVGLFAAGLSPCRVVVGHRVLTPDYDRRLSEVAAFYDPGTPSAWRREYVKEIGARYVAVPAGSHSWLADLGPVRRFPVAGAELWELGAPGALIPPGGGLRLAP